MGFETINPKGSEAMYSQFHFSQAVRSGDFVLCSGQIGAGPDGKAPADVAEEFRNAFQAVKNVLTEAGALPSGPAPICPEFSCRFRWRKNSIAFWDNRCTQHRVIGDNLHAQRRMERITIEGTKPY